MSECEPLVSKFRSVLEGYSRHEWSEIQWDVVHWVRARTLHQRAEQHYGQRISEWEDLLPLDVQLDSRRFIDVETAAGGKDNIDRYHIFGAVRHMKNNSGNVLLRILETLAYIRHGDLAVALSPPTPRDAAAIVAAYAATEIEVRNRLRSLTFVPLFHSPDGQSLTIGWLEQNSGAP